MTPAGQVLGEFPIFSASGEQVEPVLAFDGTNYLVVWRDTRNGSGPAESTDVYGAGVSPVGRVLDSSGTAIATALVSRANQVSHLTERITSWCGPMFRNLGAAHRATKSIQGQLIFP